MQRFSAAATALVVVLAGTAQAEPPFRDLPWIWPGIIEITDTGWRPRWSTSGGDGARSTRAGAGRPWATGDRQRLPVPRRVPRAPDRDLRPPGVQPAAGRTGEDITWEDPVRVYRGRRTTKRPCASGGSPRSGTWPT